MKTKIKNRRKMFFADMPKDYGTLCREIFLPRPIHDDVTSEDAFEAAFPLMGAEGRMTRDQEDWLEMMSDIIAAYEDEHEKPLPKSKPENVLRHLTEDARGWRGADLARFLGLHPTMGAKLLRGERKLTVDHIRKLAKEFNVSADLLVG